MAISIDQHKKDCDKDMTLAAMLWWQTLRYASDGGKNRIPSEQDWLSSELVAAIVKMTTGKQWWVSARHDEEGVVGLCRRGWQNSLNQALEDRAQFKEFGRWERALVMLADFVQYDRDENSNLRWFHENNALHNPGCSTFIPHQEIFRVSKQYIDNDSGLSVWDQCAYGKICEKLGEYMQPFIARDIAYIKKNYSW